MMKIAAKYSAMVLIVLALCNGCSNSEYDDVDYPSCTNDYAEYKPVFFTREEPGYDQVIVDESKADAEHYENVQIVLEYQNIAYKLVEDKILIDCNVWEDRQEMANITRRAMDKNWLQRIKFYIANSAVDSGIEMSIYNASTHEIHKTIKVPFKGVGGFSYNGKRIIFKIASDTSTDKQEVLVIDPNTGEMLGKASLQENDRSLDVSSDDRQVIVYGTPPIGSNEGFINNRIDLEPVSTNP